MSGQCSPPMTAQPSLRSTTDGTDLSEGLNLPLTLYVAPRFETGDERYMWLNRIQAIGKGIVNEDLSLDYEWYEVH
jgi:Protein of unknown function (DUF3237)